MLPDNKKTLMCRNIIITGSCKHGSECTFAHSIDEQYKSLPLKKQQIFDIITNNSHMTMKKYVDGGYATYFSTLTKICHNCVTGKCVGGLNCRNGSCDKKYVVCENNLKGNKCSCTKFHPIILHEYGQIQSNVMDDTVMKSCIKRSNVIRFDDHLTKLATIATCDITNNTLSDEDQCDKSIFCENFEKLIIKELKVD